MAGIGGRATTKRKTGLGGLATDGLVDEFFSAWSPVEDDDQVAFKADRQWNLLLDIW